MSNKPELNRPSFSAPLWAAARQGAKELSQVLKAFPDSVHPVEEPGTLGNPTMQMVTAQMGTLGTYDQMLDHYASQGHEERENEKELDR